MGEVHGLGEGGVLELVHNFVGGDLLWVEHEFYAHLFEQQLVLSCEIAFVVDAGEYLGRSQVLGKQGSDYVHLLRRCRVYGDEQVGLVDPRFSEYLDR